MNAEEWLDEQIDRLSQQRRPETPVNDETAELLAVVVAGKRLGPQAAPSLDFMRRAASAGMAPKARRRPLVRLSRYGIAVAVAAALVVGANLLPVLQSRQVVYAMTEAVAKLTTYHAVVEHRREGPGDSFFSREEFWVQGDRFYYEESNPLTGRLLRISDGERQWDVSPDQKQAFHGWAVASDLNEFSPAALAKKVIAEPYKIDGSETIAGRATVRVTVTPAPGTGEPYQLWIDKETKLPLQMQYGSRESALFTTTYTTFDLNPTIDPARFAYQPPADYQVREGGQLVKTTAEAAQIAGFQPVVPKENPKRILASKDGIAFDFGDAVVDETPAQRGIEPSLHPLMTYGWSAAGPVEFHGGNLIWFQDGLRVIVTADRDGERSVALARQLLPDLSLPLNSQTFGREVQHDVMPDMKLAMQMEQEHAKDPTLYPERVDPKAVALQFLKEQGAPVDADTLTEAGNNTVEVKYDVATGPIQRVYLRQVARNDGKGLWWVIGYDPR